MDDRTMMSLRNMRDQQMANSKQAGRRLKESAEYVVKSLEKDDLSGAGYYAASLRPAVEELLNLLLEMRVTADIVALLTQDGK